MSWFHYVGSHVHNFCDTDNGYFLEGGKGEHLLPGREIRYRCECTVPSAGEYTLQFELDTRIRLRINEIPVDYSRGIRLKGFLPQTAWKFRRGRNPLEFCLENPTGQTLSPQFRVRLIDGKGEIVLQDRKHPYRNDFQPQDNPGRQMPDLSSWHPGAGKAFKSAGRFGFTKGDGVLDYSMPYFGIIAKPHIAGNPKWKKNLLWSFSVLPDGMCPAGSLQQSYEPQQDEKIAVDWASVRWTRPDANRNPFTLEYSLLAPELLIETDADTFTLSRLAGSAACKRILLPLADGVLEHSDCDGVFYDKNINGALAENWILIYGNGAFPEIPILLLFRVPPEKILVKRDSAGAAERIDFHFGTSIQWAMLGFPGGISMLEPEDLDAAWLEHTVSICRKRSRTAPARPVGCEEYFKLENNRVEILQHYRLRFFDDAFHTEKICCAPLPPPLALAAPETSEIVLDPDARDFELPTKYGPLFTVFHSDWSRYSVPVPDTRRSFALEKRTSGALGEDFKEYLAFHDHLKEIPNPGVHQFLFPFIIPLLTFNELTEEQREELTNRLERNLEQACNPDSNYIGRDGKKCHMWYQRTEPFTGVSYIFNYLHVSGINNLPDCEKETVSNHRFPFIEVDWGNGIALYSIYLATLFTNRWNVIRSRWDVIKEAFNYYLVLMDWACMCSGYCENGRAWNDGTNYGGYLGFVNMAEMTGDREACETGIYAYAKMTAQRMGLFVASQNYYCKYFKVSPWYTAKLFPEELTFSHHHLAYPTPVLHGTYREQALYNMTTEGHYPEAFQMYAAYMPAALQDTLNAIEKSQPEGFSVTGPLENGTDSIYHTNRKQLGEQEVYSYLLLCLFSGRYSPAEIKSRIEEAIANQRLSKEFLGAHAFSYRRVPAKWCAVYLLGQASCFHQVQATLWKGLIPRRAAYPELEVTVIESQDAWIEFRSETPFELTLNGDTLPVMWKKGSLVRYRIPASGILRFR